MLALRASGAEWLRSAQRAVVVEVIGARGSVPRGCGTRMLVSRSQCEGTIGGGHLEWRAIDEARAMLASGDLTPRTAHYPLGPALGQCCGGAVTLSFSALSADALSAWPAGEPRFHLQLYGAGHVGRAIVRALAPMKDRKSVVRERV